MARPTTSARRYAEAAFQIAERDDTVDRWLTELDGAATALGSPGVAHALENPAVPLPDRHRALGEALGTTVSSGVRNLALLLLRRNRIDLMPAVARELRRLFNRRAGIVTATATTAAPLATDELRALVQRLEQMTGSRVELTEHDGRSYRVDPTILGGIVVRIGDLLIDGSVRGRLERLRVRLATGTAL